MVVLPDVFGYDTAEAKGVAKLLAHHGYATLVPDIYRCVLLLGCFAVTLKGI